MGMCAAVMTHPWGAPVTELLSAAGELPSEGSWEARSGEQGSTLAQVRLGGESAEVGRGRAAELADGGADDLLALVSRPASGPLSSRLLPRRDHDPLARGCAPDVEPSGDSGGLS